MGGVGGENVNQDIVDLPQDKYQSPNDPGDSDPSRTIEGTPPPM